MSYLSFFTASNVKRRQLKHSDYKLFCCGSFGKYFKPNDCVVSHFSRCSL